MSTKSIEHRLCCGFYDMAWLNLAAGIETLSGISDRETAETLFESGDKALLQEWIALAKPVVEAAREMTEDDRKAASDRLLTFREKLLKREETVNNALTEAMLYRKAVQRQLASETLTVPAMNVDEEVRSLLGSMFADDDPVITNLRIQYMVSAFPARMTKAHFFDLISGYASIYNGQEYSGFESFRYRLRSAALVCDIAEPDLRNRISALSEAVVNASEPAERQEAEETAGRLCEELKQESEFLEMLVRCVNPLTAITILNGLPMDVREASSVVGDACPAVLSQLDFLSRAMDGNAPSEDEYQSVMASVYDDMEQFFEPLSVLVEKETGRLQEAIDSMPEDEADAYIPVMKVTRLLSTSAFAELEDSDCHLLTKEETESLTAELTEEINRSLDGKPKFLTREIMGAVLAELPVWFDNRTEIMNYMLQSLNACRTDGERRFAVQTGKELFDSL